jgi:hypothetical protein
MMDVQKRGAVMMANHLVQLKAPGVAVPGTKVFVVEMEVLAKGEEEVAGQSLWIDPAKTVEVSEEGPCWTVVFLEFHPQILDLNLCLPATQMEVPTDPSPE